MVIKWHYSTMDGKSSIYDSEKKNKKIIPKEIRFLIKEIWKKSIFDAENMWFMQTFLYALYIIIMFDKIYMTIIVKW